MGGVLLAAPTVFQYYGCKTRSGVIVGRLGGFLSGRGPVGDGGWEDTFPPEVRPASGGTAGDDRTQISVIAGYRSSTA